METFIVGYIGIIGYMGSCQNYGPFLSPYYNTARNLIFRVPKKGP